MPHLDAHTSLTLLALLLLLLPFAVWLALQGHERFATKLWVAGGLLVGIGVGLLVAGNAALSGVSAAGHVLIIGGLGLQAVALGTEMQLTAPFFWATVGVLSFFGAVESYFSVLSFPPLRWLLGLSVVSAPAHSIPGALSLLSAVGAAAGNVAFMGLVMDNAHERGMARVRQLAEEEERERMAEVLAHVDRASNLSVISASLGLQLGQPLAAIKLTTQLLKRRVEQNVAVSLLVEELAAVVEQVRRAAHIVDQVRSFIKPPPLRLTMVDVQVLARDVWDLLRQEAQQQGVQVEFSSGGAVPLALMDRVRGSQVIMNILRSGAEARQLGAAAPIRVAFYSGRETVGVSFHLPWPASASTAGDPIDASVVAHAAVFDSRRVAAAEMLALFQAKILVRGPSPLGCEVVLEFASAEGVAAETTLETA